MIRKLVVLLVLIIAMINSGCGGGGGIDIEELERLLADAIAALQSGDFSDANDIYAAALLIDSGSTEANIGWAITELGLEIDDFALFLDPDAEPFFRKVTFFSDPVGLAFSVSGKVNGITSPIVRPGLSKWRVGATEKTAAEIQAELVKQKPVLESVVNSVRKARSGVIASGEKETWFLRIPKDVNDIPAGYYKFDYGDLALLLGGLEMARGWLDFGISIDITGVDEILDDEYYFEDPSALDTDDNDILTPEEYFPAQPGMTLRSGYSSTMRGVDDKLSDSVQYIREGIDATLAEPTDENELLPVNTDLELKDALLEARSYLDDFEDSLTDSGVVLDMAELDEDAPSILFTVSLKHLFDPAIGDWRSVAPNFVIDEWDEAILPATVADAFDDPTINGLFPGGVSGDLYDYFMMS